MRGIVRFITAVGVVALATMAAGESAAQSPSAPVLTVPTVAHVGSYTTNLRLTNGTAQPASISIAYRYHLLASGEHGTATRSVAVPPRGSVHLDDVLVSLLQVSGASDGTLVLTGDTAKVVVACELASGAGASPLSAVLPSSSAIMHAGGAEQSVSHLSRGAATRTNLILTETSGGAATVKVTLRDASGATIADRSYSVPAYAYLQVNDVYGPNGLDLPAGDRSGMTLAVRVAGGAGSVEATTTVIDNATGAAQITLLGATSGSTGGGIGIGR